jgi:hypothetical protein
MAPQAMVKSDDEFVRSGRAAASLCRTENQFAHPQRQLFVGQLQEARAEWRRRHPIAPSDETLAQCV